MSVIDLETGAEMRAAIGFGGAVEVDSKNNRILILVFDGLYEIDESTGEARTLISGDGQPNNNNPFELQREIAVDNRTNRALILERTAVKAVELSTGERAFLSRSTL